MVQVFPQLSILGANVGAGLEFTVCILLGSFMSSEHDYLVCICTTEGSNKGQQRGFLKATLWRLVLPGSTDEMTRQCDRRELGTEPWVESQGTKFWQHSYHLLLVLQNKALSDQVSP